jgi:AraC family transcriptional regulator of adaptative response/methylated-DNA-[protein]-cysteine methyltransferase
MEHISELDDYAKVRAVLERLHADWREQPSLSDLAQPVGLSEDQLQKLFTRWAGLTPKAFLQALTLDHARAMLKDRASILDTALDSGLSGPGRLHDLFIAHEAMSPGAYKAKGEGLAIAHAFHPSPFGLALVMVTEHGLCGLSFADEGGEAATLEDMMSRWPRATYAEDSARTAPYAARAFSNLTDGQPLRITMIGSDFEIRVWETLLKIPRGKAVSYGDIAKSLGKPKAARAVGAAVGKNPISFVVPCHRVLGSTGALTGYHWGLTRKKAILGWEAGKLAS